MCHAIIHSVRYTDFGYGCNIFFDFEKTLKHFWRDDCQFSYIDVMLRGSFTGSSVRPIHTPWKVYSMQRLKDSMSMSEGIAVHRGCCCCRPISPLFVDMLLINWEWSGIDVRSVSEAKKSLIIRVNWSFRHAARPQVPIVGKL